MRQNMEELFKLESNRFGHTAVTYAFFFGLFGVRCGNSMFKQNMFVSLFDCVVQPTPAVAATNSTHVGAVGGTYPESVQGMC
jgi:hypothetical protein